AFADTLPADSARGLTDSAPCRLSYHLPADADRRILKCAATRCCHGCPCRDAVRRRGGRADAPDSKSDPETRENNGFFHIFCTSSPGAAQYQKHAKKSNSVSSWLS